MIIVCVGFCFYIDVDKIVGFAVSHHVKHNKIDAPAKNAKLVLSSER